MRLRGDAIKWRMIFWVPREPLCSLQSNVMVLNVLMYSEDWESLDGDVDSSCLRVIKKISTVKPKPPAQERSCKRHNCSCTKSLPQRGAFSSWKDLRSSNNACNCSGSGSHPSTIFCSLGKMEERPAVQGPGGTNGRATLLSTSVAWLKERGSGRP